MALSSRGARDLPPSYSWVKQASTRQTLSDIQMLRVQLQERSVQHYKSHLAQRESRQAVAPGIACIGCRSATSMSKDALSGKPSMQSSLLAYLKGRAHTVQ